MSAALRDLKAIAPELALKMTLAEFHSADIRRRSMALSVAGSYDVETPGIAEALKSAAKDPDPELAHQVVMGLIIAVLLASLSVRANPIVLPEKPIASEIGFLLASAILLEVACVWLVLRRSATPRFFVLRLIGMHLLTYPGFMGLLAALDNLRPASAVLIGELVVIVAEGAIIYLMCHLLRSAESERAAPSALKCWLASLAGNACSAAAFPILSAIHDQIVSR